MPTTTATIKIAFLALVLMMASVTGASAELRIWSSTQEAGDAFFEEFINGDEETSRQFIISNFGGEVKPNKLIGPYRKWLGTGELHSIKLIGDDRLGDVLTRETYAVQKVSQNLMFMRLSFVAVPKGWALYYVQFQTDIGKFYPGWRDPN